MTRTTQYALKKTLKIKIPSKVVTTTYAKKHPKSTVKTTVYLAKKTGKYTKGKRVPEAYAKRYRKMVKKVVEYKTKPKVKLMESEQIVSREDAKKYRKYIKQVQYVQIEERPVVFDPVLKKQTYGEWRVTSKERLNYYERIMNVKELTNRHVRQVLAANRIFNNIWQNHKGIIRVTVNGFVGGEHVKDVAHIGYLKSIWSTKHDGYSQFKDYVVNKILQSLRRHRLRLSNEKESRERLVDLHRKLKDAYNRLEHAPSWNVESIAQGIKEIKKMIRQQKQSRQLTGGTIRIEKLVPQ